LTFFPPFPLAAASLRQILNEINPQMATENEWRHRQLFTKEAGGWQISPDG